MKPYVVRLISLEKKVGKTSIGVMLVDRIIKMGYRVAVIKHSHRQLDIEKDSEKYLKQGADPVVAVGPKETIIYYNKSIDLEQAVASAHTPIVIIEGYKSARLGDAIGLVRSIDECIKLREECESIIAFIDVGGFNADNVEGTPVYKADDIDSVTELIASRALEHVMKQVAGRNCGMCGYSSCLDFAKAFLRGETCFCPARIDTLVKVNGKVVELNPFIKGLIINTLVGFLRTLKGTPKDPCEYTEIEILFRAQP